MKQTFTSAAEVACALKNTDLVDDVVRDMAGGDKALRGRLMDVVETHFIADARTMSVGHLNRFAQELFDVARREAEPA